MSEPTVTITFGPENRIASVGLSEPVSPGTLEKIMSLIQEDPLWLQSPADRETSETTEATVPLSEFLDAWSNVELEDEPALEAVYEARLAYSEEEVEQNDMTPQLIRELILDLIRREPDFGDIEVNSRIEFE